MEEVASTLSLSLSLCLSISLSLSLPLSHSFLSQPISLSLSPSYELPQYGSRRKLISPAGLYDEYGEVVVDDDGSFYYSPQDSETEVCPGGTDINIRSRSHLTMELLFMIYVFCIKELEIKQDDMSDKMTLQWLQYYDVTSDEGGVKSVYMRYNLTRWIWSVFLFTSHLMSYLFLFRHINLIVSFDKTPLERHGSSYVCQQYRHDNRRRRGVAAEDQSEGGR